MAISEKIIRQYKSMEIVEIDQQVLLLCKNGMFDKVNLLTLYQQFKTAVALENVEAYEVYRSVLKNWLDDNEIEFLKNTL